VKNNCLICGEELVYTQDSNKHTCEYCNSEKPSNTVCKNGHFVCDDCHQSPAYKIIKELCVSTKLKDPFEIAIMLMKLPQIKMHGPEHHFLVPAALIAAFANNFPKKLNNDEKSKLIDEAEKRAKNVLGGFCGFYGACGAGIGNGIFISLLQGATPLSENEWRQCNNITANTLLTISEYGGPRCCKRNTFLALHEAIVFLHYELDCSLKANNKIKCEFHSLNKECLKSKCPYH
jgi:hypothetical protein